MTTTFAQPPIRANIPATLERVSQQGTFLPLVKIRDNLADWRVQYQNATPFPHLVIDNLFDTDILNCVLSEFPTSQRQQQWTRFRGADEYLKNATNYEYQIPFFTRHFIYALNSETFLNVLSAITGIEGLIADMTFEGGGLHHTDRGGHLELHSDFNKHTANQLDRHINLLLYLNRDWQEQYGGHLELWDKDMIGCRSRLLPIFNRCVVFGTTDFTYHGHPHPVTCPEGMSRKSIALYYFSKGRPASEVSGTHTTLFQNRPKT
jgi:Rps23 Pro-64 3,4-dihydroxylase Tpa1-like proline 4-hydroxylase